METKMETNKIYNTAELLDSIYTLSNLAKTKQKWSNLGGVLGDYLDKADAIDNPSAGPGDGSSNLVVVTLRRDELDELVTLVYDAVEDCTNKTWEIETKLFPQFSQSSQDTTEI